MATIKKRGESYVVVYRYSDMEGKTTQRWETFKSYHEALKRKTEVEGQIMNNELTLPTTETVSDFLQDFVDTYGAKRWGTSMYSSQTRLIRNYINPLIGSMKIQDITPRTVDKFILALQKTTPVSTKTHRARTEFVTDYTIEKVIKLLRCAFKQAVRWDIISKNPFDSVVLAKTKHRSRSIWTATDIKTALDACDDPLLEICIHIAFACSCRLAEILGLTWDHVHVSDEDICKGNAHIEVVQELERASCDALNKTSRDSIYYTFKPLMGDTTTRLVLKKPKTDSSIRKIWLPKTVAYLLRDTKQEQESLKNDLGDEYEDFNLVVALPNGRPCEKRLIEKRFSQLKKKSGLPDVVFHSLRHSSTTYKLKLNHGDLKAT